MPTMPDPFPSLLARIKRIEERQNNRGSVFTGTGWSIIDIGQVAQDGSVTIPNNGLLLVDGGDVVMLNESLVEVFRVGVMEFMDRGIVVRREDGTPAWEMRKAFGPDDPQQAFVIRDRLGAVIAGDALLSPAGFDAPHMAMPFTPVDYTSAALAQSTSSTSFVATHEHRGFRQNPALKPQFQVKCSDATTAAEIQVYDVLGATYLGGFLSTPAVQTITVPAGTTAFTLFELASGALALPGAMSDPLHLQIHVRRTAGTGSVTVAPVRTIGGGF